MKVPEDLCLKKWALETHTDRKFCVDQVARLASAVGKGFVLANGLNSAFDQETIFISESCSKSHTKDRA